MDSTGRKGPAPARREMAGPFQTRQAQRSENDLRGRKGAGFPLPRQTSIATDRTSTQNREPLAGSTLATDRRKSPGRRSEPPVPALTGRAGNQQESPLSL